jgi:hypothetical protein
MLGTIKMVGTHVLSSHWNHKDCNEGDPDYDENELEVLYFLTFTTS